MKNDNINILFGGDITEGLSLNKISNFTQSIFDDNLTKIIAEQDAFFVNLESPLTSREKHRKKIGVKIKSRPDFVNILENAKITNVSLANNHIFDFEEIGVEDTKTILQNSNIQFAGVGKNPQEASIYTKYIYKEQSFGIFFWAEHEFNYLNEISQSTGLIDPAENILAIQRAKKECDFVIVFSHCGPELVSYPSPRTVKLFRAFVCAGADAVINSHSHQVMGWEYFNDKPIVYSLGNLFFPSSNNSLAWNNGMLAQLIFQGENVKLKCLYTKLDKDKNIVELTKNINNLFLNEPLKNEEKLRALWDSFCKSQEKHLIKECFKAIIAMLPYLVISKFFKKTPQKVESYFKKGCRMFRGFWGCENHIETFFQILNKRIK